MKKLLLFLTLVSPGKFYALTCPDVKVTIKYRNPESGKVQETETFTGTEIFGIKCSGFEAGSFDDCSAPKNINWKKLEYSWNRWWTKKNDQTATEAKKPQIVSVKVQCNNDTRIYKSKGSHT